MNFTRILAYLSILLICSYGLLNISHAQPINDNICDARPLVLDTSCGLIPNANNIGATSQTNEPKPSCFEGGISSVWFTFIAPSTGYVNIYTDKDVSSTNRDTELALFELNGSCTDLSNLSFLACNQDGFGVGNGQPILPFNSKLELIPVTPGEEYYLQVSGWGAPTSTETIQGTFCIEVQTADAPLTAEVNDSFCKAKFLTLGSTCSGPNGSNAGASAEPGEPEPPCFSGELASVWFKFVGPPSGYSSIKTDRDVLGTNEDTEIAIYTLPVGNCEDLSNLELVECDQDNGRGVEFNAAINAIPTAAGDTFYIQLSGWEGTQGSFCIEVDEVFPPQNDSLCNAQEIIVGEDCSSTGNADNTGATFEQNETYPSCFSGGLQSIWYKFVAPQGEYVSIITENPTSSADFDTQVALYQLENDNCEDLTRLDLVGCSQDGLSLTDLLARLDTIKVDSGETYYIQASGAEGVEGSFCIKVIEVPPPFASPNDNVCNARQIPTNGEIFTFSHVNAGTEPGEQILARPEGGCSGNDGWCGDTAIQNSLWFTFTAPASGGVTIDLCNGGGQTTFDTQLALYEIGQCEDFSSYTFLGANEDEPDCSTASLLSVRCLAPGQSYHVLVDGYNGEEGIMSISISELSPLHTELEILAEGPTCKNGTNGFIDLALAGVVNPISYQWNTGDTLPALNGVKSGQYAVIVTDACDSVLTATVELSEPQPFSLDAGDDELVCFGKSIRLGGNPTGAGGATFQPERMYFVDVQDSVFARVRLSSPTASLKISDGLEGSFFAGDFAPDGFYVLEASESQLLKLDTLSGTISLVGNTSSIDEQVWVGMAWNFATQKMYGLSVGQIGNAQLYTINLSTGQAVPKVNVPGLSTPIWLAISKEGDFYTLDIDTDRIYQIDPETGTPSLLGPVGFDASFAQDADFDPITNQLYLGAYQAGSSQTELRIVDLSTGQSSPIGLVDGTGEIGAMGISAKQFTESYDFKWASELPIKDSLGSNPIVTPSGSISYYVKAMDACGEIRTDSVLLTTGGFDFSLEVDINNDSMGGALNANVNGGVPPISYLWNSGDTTSQLIDLIPGYYQVEVSDAQGCTIRDSVYLLITDIEEQANSPLNQLKAYTSHDQILILEVLLTKVQPYNLTLQNTMGQVVWRASDQNSMQKKYSLPTQLFSQGVYILSLDTREGVYHKKFILN